MTQKGAKEQSPWQYAVHHQGTGKAQQHSTARNSAAASSACIADAGLGLTQCNDRQRMQGKGNMKGKGNSKCKGNMKGKGSVTGKYSMKGKDNKPI